MTRKTEKKDRIIIAETAIAKPFKSYWNLLASTSFSWKCFKTFFYFVVDALKNKLEYCPCSLMFMSNMVPESVLIR
jgi:hypothetical protein